MNKENKNNIKKFQEYINILEDKIVYVDNEISIIYRINKNEDNIKIFDIDFVKDKKDIC